MNAPDISLAKTESVYVIDSYAILALLREESGAPRVRELLDLAKKKEIQLLMSAINFGEIIYITERANGLQKAQDVIALIEQLDIEIVSATHKRVLDAAHIKANYPVSYADAFAIAATREFDAIAVTADPEFRSVEELIQVDWLSANS